MGDLRRATVADAPDLTRLRGLMFAAMGVDPDVPGWEDACEQALVRRLADQERFAAWVVEVEGRVVSGGVGWVEEHLPGPGLPDGRRGHVASMSTEPGHRRSGCARQVLVALMAWFADAGVPRVDLRATAHGLPLYEELGFRAYGGAALAWVAPGAAALPTPP